MSSNWYSWYCNWHVTFSNNISCDRNLNRLWDCIWSITSSYNSLSWSRNLYRSWDRNWSITWSNNSLSSWSRNINCLLIRKWDWWISFCGNSSSRLSWCRNLNWTLKLNYLWNLDWTLNNCLWSLNITSFNNRYWYWNWNIISSNNSWS